MTLREDYRRFLHFEPGARPPATEPGPLLSTYERWKSEGLPPELTPYDYDAWCRAFGLDPWPLSVAWHPKKAPLFEEQILAETETTVTKRMTDGSIQEHKKGTLTTIPHELQPAVRSKADWERLKEWLDADAPLTPADTPALAAVFQRAREADRPVMLSAGSLVGVVRNWVGFETFAMLAYDDPAWLEDMLETCCRACAWQIRLFGENRVPIDVIHFWEDICFKNGPMMNPAHFHALATPRYRRLADLAAGYGYDRLEVDSDGNITALIDAWVDGGVNMLCPLEVQAGMDINVLQQQYGRQIVWSGGIHKPALAGGEAAIATELKRVRPAVERGGYLPMLDHQVPAEVSLQNYRLYLKLKCAILGIGTGECRF